MIAICVMLVTVSVPETAAVFGASNAVLQVSNSQLMKGKDNSIVINLKDNNKTIAGMEFFIQFDTDAFSVNDVVSKLSDKWELDWKAKNDAKYGEGVLCMIQDSTTKGITDSDKGIVAIKLDDVNAQVDKEYKFKINIIDVCDNKGNSIKSSVSGVDGTFRYLKEQKITISEDVKIEGFQISNILKGLRTVSSVEPKINNKEVVEFGNIYALAVDDVTDKDMYIGSPNYYVKGYKATTENGVIQNRFSDSKTAINYARTMTENGTTSEAYTQEYMIRGYAKLSDGSYVYSKAYKYTIFKVAKVLYDNVQMSTNAGHDYLYNDILKVVDKNYKKVDYNWSNIIVKP